MASLRNRTRLNLTVPASHLINLFLLGMAASLCLASAIYLHGCKSGPTEPPPKNPREYAWTIDTLAYPESSQTTMRAIWGSSANDVYVVGHNDRSLGVMWHYDGRSWRDVKLNKGQGGPLEGAMDLSAVAGYSSSNVVCVGERVHDNPKPPPNFIDSSRLIRFNGLTWSEEQNVKGRALWSVTGSGPNDIWTCGRGGTLFHFDGVAWRKDSVQLTVPAGADYSLWDIKTTGISGEVFMIAYVNESVTPRTTRYFFKCKNQRWALIDSSVTQSGLSQNRFGEVGLWVSSNGTLYSFGTNIFRWTGTGWLKVLDTSTIVEQMSGTSDENILAVGGSGKVLHFNGSAWEELAEIKLAGVTYVSAWTDGNQAFVVGITSDYSQKTLIMHGK